VSEKPAYEPLTEQAKKDMRAEVLSLVLDMAISPEQRAKAATEVVSRSLAAQVDGDTVLLMRAAAMVAVQDMMTQVRIMSGRVPSAKPDLPAPGGAR
jgi:hypothetical protein